jgi:hypothetical protein
MIYKKKRTKKSKSDRFYTDDIIENKVTGKKLVVGDVHLAKNGDVMWYDLYNIRIDGRRDFEDYNRYIKQEAFNNWNLLVSL